MTYGFVQRPQGDDFFSLAVHIATAPQGRLHSSLWTRRVQVADRLRRMGQEPAGEAHRAIYHALRLLVW